LPSSHFFASPLDPMLLVLQSSSQCLVTSISLRFPIIFCASPKSDSE
jgi:hypothetical protein